MSRFPKAILVGAVGLFALSAPALAGDAAAGEKVFRKCQSCHAIGEGATNKVGPELNNIIGRTAGTAPDYKYSNAMSKAGEDGLVWSSETLSKYLAKPRDFVKGTRMTFAGLRSKKDVENIVAYLASFSDAPAADSAAAAPADAAPTETAQAETSAPAEAAPATASGEGAGLHYHLGRVATSDEVAAWNIDVRPDGTGLPEGHGTVARGGELYDANCAACHGDFGEAIGRWPVLAGGRDTLTDQRPVKTVGSYWPYLSTVYDYIRRAMPFGNARAFTNDDYYALTAYILYLNDIVTDDSFELNKDNFTSIHLPNEQNFIADNRDQEAHNANKGDPCMTDCVPGKAKITMHAAVLDVTPDAGADDNSASGNIE